MRIRRPSALALLGGIAVALSLPPWGWWPLAWVGFALLYRATEAMPWRRRLLLGWLFGVGQFGIGLFWMTEFTLPGGILAGLFSALFPAIGVVATPPTKGGRRALAFPAALVLGEALRLRFPFGGVPPGGVPLGQITGWFGPTARIGGSLLLVALTATAGVLLSELPSKSRTRGARFGRQFGVVGVAIAIVAIAAVAVIAPAGSPTGRRLHVGIVQGGGRRGFRAIETDPQDVYDAHLEASAALHPRLDLILWPEDVIAVEGNVAQTDVARDLAAMARDHHATLVAGVVEGEGTDHFRNAAVAWSPDGNIVGRYEKVHRVPFGEYVPFRSLVRHLADLSAVPDDEVSGHGPNVLATPAGRLGVAISYEVFFADRGRDATTRHAGLMLVPTNAASFKTSQVPTQEIAAAQLLAVSSGRTVLQAGPTGYSAVITHDGRVRQRTVLGRRQVLHATVAPRRGRTIYAVIGDWPLIALAAAAVLTGWSRRR